MEQNNVFSQRAFVFAVEALIAVILVAGFLQIAKISPYETTYLSKIQLKQLGNDVSAVLDENGFVLDVLDQNSLNASQKMDGLFSKISSLVPNFLDFRIELKELDSNSANCIIQKTFSGCFIDLNSFAPKGNEVPLDKDVMHERFFFAKKQPSPECQIIEGASFSPEKELFYEKQTLAFFNELKLLDGKNSADLFNGMSYGVFGKKSSAVFLSNELNYSPIVPLERFDLDSRQEIVESKSNASLPNVLFFESQANDLNLTFGVSSNPSGSATCDQSIRVDLNASIPDYGRSVADVVLIADKSGSMADYINSYLVSSDKIDSNHLASGSFDSGTCSKKDCQGGGNTWNNWQNLKTFGISSSIDFQVLMDYSGYGGSNSPHLRLLAPNGSTYYPGSTGDSGSSPLSVSVSSPAIGTWTIQGWSDDAINYDLTFVAWQNLNTVTVSTSKDFRIVMSYSGYGGSNSPFLRLKSPSGAYYPSSSGDGGSSPLIATATSPALGVWTIQGKSDSNIFYDLNYYIHKIDAAKTAADNFVDLNLWQSQDYMGLVSFSTSATLNQSLTADRVLVKTAINALSASGATNTGGGITTANNELTVAPTGHKRQNSLPYEVLLTDGGTSYCSTCTAGNPSTCYCPCRPSVWNSVYAAQSKGIKLYTIGFGPDLKTLTSCTGDPATRTYADDLNAYAEYTGGKYYYSGDANILNDLYQTIGIQIGADLNVSDVNSKAYDSNLQIPIGKCSYLTDLNGATCSAVGDQNLLKFQIGTIDRTHSWLGHYTVYYPCDDSNSCSSSFKILPPSNTFFYWKDSNGISRTPILFDKNATVSFQYRDLALNFVQGRIVSANQLFLDVNAKNIGYLDSGSTAIDFYLNDPTNGIPLRHDPVQAFCGGKNLICSNYFAQYDNLSVSNLGYIYATINRDGAIRECPSNNTVSIYCSGMASTRYYILDLWMWKK